MRSKGAANALTHSDTLVAKRLTPWIEVSPRKSRTWTCSACDPASARCHFEREHGGADCDHQPERPQVGATGPADLRLGLARAHRTFPELHFQSCAGMSTSYSTCRFKRISVAVLAIGAWRRRPAGRSDDPLLRADRAPTALGEVRGHQRLYGKSDVDRLTSCHARGSAARSRRVGDLLGFADEPDQPPYGCRHRTRARLEREI